MCSIEPLGLEGPGQPEEPDDDVGLAGRRQCFGDQSLVVCRGFQAVARCEHDGIGAQL